MEITAEATSLQRKLLETQNPDGGWSFQGKTSWTEPTAFAVLALSIGSCSQTCARATEWLKETQQPDGGWSPQPQVQVSTWLTSLVTLALLRHDWKPESRDRALNWLQRQMKTPESLLVRLVAEFKGQPVPEVNRFGSSWYPGTAAWIYPSAFSVLAFLHLSRLSGNRLFRELAQKGQEYILSRRCSDGGWNHGGSRFGNEDPVSYPEITGLALLALDGVEEKRLQLSLTAARQFLAEPLSGEGLAWLQMGLSKHGIKVPPSTKSFSYRGPREIALRLLALSAGNPANTLTSFQS